MFSLINNQASFNDGDEILSKTVITEKKFVVDSLHYHYANTYKIQKSSQSKQSSQLEIKNLPCVMVGDQIKKIIQIHYCGQTFYIQDNYTISVPNSSDKLPEIISQPISTSIQVSTPSIDSSNKQQKDSEKTSSKKFCLFKKLKGKGQKQKRNTKNIPKNFCKAFLNFLEVLKSKKTDKQRVTDCINYLKNLIGDKKYYNNPIILKIISSNKCKELFRLFLSQHAKNWIERSKMDNKKVHLDAIQIYLRLYEKRTFLQGDQDQEQQS